MLRTMQLLNILTDDLKDEFFYSFSNTTEYTIAELGYSDPSDFVEDELREWFGIEFEDRDQLIEFAHEIVDMPIEKLRAAINTSKILKGA